MSPSPDEGDVESQKVEDVEWQKVLHNHDREGFSELVRRSGIDIGLRQWLARHVSGEDAKDLSQEVLIAVCRELSK